MGGYFYNVNYSLKIKGVENLSKFNRMSPLALVGAVMLVISLSVKYEILSASN